MQREYENATSKYKIKGWYYDLQTDPDESRITCVTLHPNAELKGAKWEKISGQTDPDDDFENKYRLEPLCVSIINEDFNVSVANSWSDFGGDMIGQMWESVKPLAPYAEFAKDAIGKAVNSYDELMKAGGENAQKLQESKVSRTLAAVFKKINTALNSGEVDIAEYLNRSLVMQGTRFSYYSGTGTSFGNLGMRFTVLPKWNGSTFETVNSQIKKLFPYTMGQFVEEHLSDAPDLDGIIGWQKPPGGFKATIKNVDVVQFGTLKLKIGGFFAITNLVCESATFTYSKQMVKCPMEASKMVAEGESIELLSPLYCDVALQLRPATKYSDKSVKEFVFGNRTKTTMKKVNKAMRDKLIAERADLMSAYARPDDGILGTLTNTISNLF